MPISRCAELIKKALTRLNGSAKLNDIYNLVPEYSQSHIRRTIQSHSSDTKTFPKSDDIFFTVEGLGQGIWGLRNFIINEDFSPKIEKEQPFYINNKIPERVLSICNRIVRDTVLVKELKKLVNYQCQLCEIRIPMKNGESYVEGHHIRPLGSPYNGPDSQDNIIIVCPNCHVMCDYKLIKLSLSQIKNNKQKVSPIYINFHNEEYNIRIEG